MSRHLLVTNDFPPKVGGIQSYLWELWRRLPPDDVVVHTTPYRDDTHFDAVAPFPVVRSSERVLLPTPMVVRRVRSLAAAHDVDLVLYDPAIPVGLAAPTVGLPYGVVLHGAEVTVPGRLPGTAQALGRVLRGAEIVVSAGGYAAREAERCAGRRLPVVIVPPGVDTARFRPLDDDARTAARARFGIEPGDLTIGSVSRLVPRKGMDVLIEAAARLRDQHPSLRVLIAGRGRDEARLRRRIAATGAPVELVGFVGDDDLPLFYGALDVFAMLCRNRWGGLEQEGFGIVFAEAAACGVPVVCGRSGGSAEAVEDGVTGIVVDRPTSVRDTVAALEELCVDASLRHDFGAAGRRRVVERFDYDVLAARLAAGLEGIGGGHAR
jgi:phosphatidylinositol alpha-1,6-mannosyltransferase